MDFYKLQILLLTLLCSAHSSTTDTEVTELQRYVKPQSPSFTIEINSTRFLKARVPYYHNSNATFQLCLLIAGDVNPNPGPVNCAKNTSQKSGDQRITYDREKLLELKDFGKNNHIRPDVWNCIKILKINSKPVTHRGIGSRLNRTRKRQYESTQS